eukprot:TRINITY_DN12141_c0_g2_i1.p2 TRINITY_DN12141_c0_g2~~TRINITY_DN12141_c0_g2_i1.p2  ORF type:complete len:218 (+),score=42.13 TRINITY_DN12141_c0_g2_i1:1071-1724(+)
MGLFSSKDEDVVLEDETNECDIVAEVQGIHSELRRSIEEIQRGLDEGSEIVTAAQMGISIMNEAKDMKGDGKRALMDERVKAHVKQLQSAVRDLRERQDMWTATHIEIRRKLQGYRVTVTCASTEALISQLILLSRSYTTALGTQRDTISKISANLKMASDYLASSLVIINTGHMGKKPLIAGESTAHSLGSRGRLGTLSASSPTWQTFPLKESFPK